jgi:PAS domain S-box-containing protein
MVEQAQFEAAFRQILESAPDSVLVVDHQGKIVLANQMLKQMFGYEPDEVIGESIELFMPERFRSGHVGLRENFLNNPHVRFMGTGLTLYAQRKDGNEFPVEISLTPLETHSGLMVSAAIRDISDRINIQHELEQRLEELGRSNAELEQFAYVASHDLQEPLRVVASFAQLLSQRYEGQLDKDADEFIHYIVDGATRMQDLINDLLAYSRVSTKGKEFKATDCNKVLEQILQNLRFTIEDAHAEVTWKPLPTVMADESQLRQLFQNLISNAIKFRGDEPAKVHIWADQEDGQSIFHIQDNGIGIDPQYVERIFLLFQRLHGKKEYPGTGIGLAICKKIVERHHGRLWVESNPGQGSTFSFSIASVEQ